VLATAALNLAACLSFTSTAPIAWVGAAVAAVTVVAAALPSSSAGPRQPSGPGE
jgi:hypothetical protein